MHACMHDVDVLYLRKFVFLDQLDMPIPYWLWEEKVADTQHTSFFFFLENNRIERAS